MRINTSRQPQHGRPNALFAHYGELLTYLLESRRPTTSSTYVPIPDVEKSVLAFTRSAAANAVGLLVGSIGIGKSSVLNHLNEKEWSNEKCRVLFDDFATHEFSSDLGSGFVSLSPKEQRLQASIVARNAIIDKLREDLLPYIRQNEKHLFSFIETHSAGLLNSEATWKPCDANISDYMISIERSHPMELWCNALIHCMLEEEKTHVKYVIDNIDDKNDILISQFVETLAHFQRYFNLISKKIMRKDMRFTPLIACRKATSERIRELVDFDNAENTGRVWMGLSQIMFEKPCSIAEALRRRYASDVKDLIAKGVQVREKINVEIGKGSTAVKWETTQQELFSGLVDLIERSKQFDDILELCNYNVADTMNCVLKVLTNRYFIQVTDIFHVARSETSDRHPPPDDLLTGTTAIRSLAYGNQRGTDPIYPIEGTLISNLLESNGIPFSKSLLKLRIMAILFDHARLAPDGTHAVSSEVLSCYSLCNLLVEKGGTTANDVKQVVNEMCAERLVTPGHTIRNSHGVGDDEALIALPKGIVLFKHLQNDSVLLECWRDTSDLDKDLLWNEKPVDWMLIPSRSVFSDRIAAQVFYIVWQAWKVEERDLSVYSNKRKTQIIEKCGGLLSRRILAGFKGSMQRYYSHSLPEQWQQTEVYDMINKLEQEHNKYLHVIKNDAGFVASKQ